MRPAASVWDFQPMVKQGLRPMASILCNTAESHLERRDREVALDVCRGEHRWFKIALVYFRHSSLAPFLFFSSLIHLLLLAAWPRPEKKEREEKPIPVAFVRLPEAKSGAGSPRKPRPVEPPAQAPKNQAPLRGQTEERQASPRENELSVKAPESDPRPATQEEVFYAKRAEKTPELRSPVIEPALPTLKELLPPGIWVRAEEGGAISLDTREPRYLSYFSRIKQAIELVWEYPEPALRSRLEGKLVLEFTILENGQLEELRLIRSSGSAILDNEAARAVKAASPFEPIPPSIGKSRLQVIASFEYLDNRLRYGILP